MSFSINTNIASMQAQEYLRATTEFQGKTINRVTSGLRIVNSGDDAAGLAIANSYRSDQAVLTQGIRNANDGLATMQTIDSGINNISKLLDRARTLATQSASDTFTGDRAVLNNEFQNVVSEINRQAQAIGMVSGGDFAKNLNVFIGGGRNSTGGSNQITNGTVSVDLSQSLLDTKSLGLGAAGVQGADLRSGTNVLSGTVGGTAPVFTFRGAGFTGGVSVDLAGLWGSTNVKNEHDAVAQINKAIDVAAANNTAFSAAGIRASIDEASGKLTFTSTSAFQVQAGTGSTTAEALLATTNQLNAASSSMALTYSGVLVDANTQVLNVTWRNASGNLATQAVNLAAGNTATLADTVGAINNALNGQGGLFAVANQGNILLMSSTGASFQMDVNARSGGTGGVNAGAAAQLGSSSVALGSSTALDISSAGNATTAVTSLANAVKSLGAIQANVGKAQNQINFAVSLASTQLTNLAASESRIRDADLAQEAANLTRAQILQQAGVAALAQANSAPQAVLSLLRG